MAILVPTDFHMEWNVTTFILWVFALHLIQSKSKGSFQHAGELTVWTTAKFIPLPHDWEGDQPMQQWLHSRWWLWEHRGPDVHSVCPCNWQEKPVSGGTGCKAVFVTSWTRWIELQLPLCITQPVWEQDSLAVVVDTLTPSKMWLAFLINSFSSNLHLSKPSCLLCGCGGRMDATLCP